MYIAVYHRAVLFHYCSSEDRKTALKPIDFINLNSCDANTTLLTPPSSVADLQSVCSAGNNTRHTESIDFYIFK